jgi:hAT family C-terminal dimerisation region
LKDTDIVEWWQVSTLHFDSPRFMLNSAKDHAQLYPTLARIALNVLPCQASSVPCERLFSASKQTADYRRASLGTKRFEELQVMKFAWQRSLDDLATWNSSQIEVVDSDEYSQMLEAEDASAEFDGVGTSDRLVIES